MTPLRAAASALLEAAPETTVLTVLRLLIDSVAPAPARAPVDPLQPAKRPAPPKRQPAAAAAPATPDPTWEVLSGQVRAAMAARGLSYADVGQAVGRSEIGIRICLSSRKPAPGIVRTRLREWLEQAPAVAAPIPFRGSNRGNGHDSAAGGYNSAA
jgi:hypothetical protein